MPYFVKIVSAPTKSEEGTKIAITLPQTLIGRVSPPCQIKLEGTKVSKKHCSLVLNGDLLAIKDHNSSNGVYVNGKKVDEMKLKEKDRIVIGEFTLEVAVK